MKKTTLLIFVSTLLIFGCDKVDQPFPATEPPVAGDLTWDDSLYVSSSNTLRKILLEEFTGHKCSQCPGGALKIEELLTKYGDTLIPVSIHGGHFAQPQPGTGKFETDFRTTLGEAFNAFPSFASASYPAGMVSRLAHTNGKITNGKDIWEMVILNILNNNPTPKVKISITSLYNEANRTIKERVETEWLSAALNDTNKLQVYVIEDHIIDWQTDNTSDIENYEHKHVFRKALNSSFGTTIPASNVGATDLQEFTAVIPEEWNIDNCSIVALVYDATTYEVLQVEEVHIKN